MGRAEFLASARTMRAMSSAPIFRMLVEHTNSGGRIVFERGKRKRRLRTASDFKPSRFKASLSRFEK